MAGSESPSTDIEPRWARIARRAAMLAVVASVLGLVGWITRDGHFTSGSVALRPMVPDTSIVLVLEGAAIALLARTDERGRARPAAMALAFAAVVIAAIELYEWGTGRAVLLGAALSTPPPTLLTTVSVLVLGVALLSIDVRTRARSSPAQYLAIACMIVPLVTTVGYVFREPLLYDMPAGSRGAIGMPLSSAVAVSCLCIGLLAARPSTPLMAPITSQEISGTVARRFLFALFLAPIVGLVGMAVELAFGWPQEVAEGLLAVTAIIVGAVLVFRTARWMNDLDTARRRAHEDALRWKEFFDRAAFGAVLVDASGTIVKANAAYATMYGYEPSELVGMPVEKLVPEADRGKLPELFALAAELGHMRFETERERKDGTRFHAAIDVTALEDEKGAVSQYASYVQDISEQRAAEQARARLATIVETTDDAILSADTDGVLLSTNAAAERLFGYKAAELVGRSASVFVPPELGDEFERLLVRIRRGERIVGYDTVRMRKDGTRFPVSLTLSPVRDATGRIAMVSSIARDITALKELERRRAEWSSLVAHDLRQPLHAIVLNAHVASELLRQTSSSVAPRALDSLRRILAATDGLERMVNDLTDVSRLEASHMQLETRPIDLEGIVAELLARIAPTVVDHPLRLETHGARRPVVADAARIEQVLTNLVSNAVKYGDPQTEVAVDIDWKRDDVEIAVTNHGPGIAPDDLWRVFDRFERTKTARASGAPGLGLGLYICRGLVEAHHGRIWVESTPGAWTSFHVELPAPAQAAVQRGMVAS